MDIEEAKALAGHLLAVKLPRRWRHVQGVGKKALSAAVLFDANDADALVSSAFLHDIGYSPEVRRSGFHALDGARFLDAQGVHPRLCSLVAHHSFAYREAELRGMSADLALWTDEQTAVRDALWWADMTTTPDGESTKVLDRIEEIQKRYGPEDLVTFFIQQARPELEAAVARTEERLRAAGIGYSEK